MVAVLLAPGDLIVLAGSARHGWTHEGAGVGREGAGAGEADFGDSAAALPQGECALHGIVSRLC
jgi:hypothetical protein